MDRHFSERIELTQDRLKALRQSERKYRALFEDALNPILVVDEDGRYIDANQAALDFLECEREELLGKSVWDFAAPGTLEEAREEHEPFVEARTLETDYFVNGRTKTLLLNVVPLTISGETVLYGIGQDITERKKAQEQLAFQSTLLDQIHDMVTATDLEGRITYVNQAECRVMGKTEDELIGQHVESYGEDPERGATQQEIIETTLAEGEWRGEVVNIAEDGREIILDCRTRLVHDERGERVGMVGISTDITERKRAEEEIERYAAELERSNRDLERFGYVISHDLREPARVVKSYLELLERRYRGQLDEKAELYIDYAVDGAERMEKMIRALLNLSRVGTRGGEPEPTDAEAVLERTLNSLERAIEETEAQVTHGPLPTVMADEAQLGQVFQNLIANAIKFRREDVPPRVHISAEEADGEWVFSVEDNGIGIDPKQADRIFQVFERLHTNEEYPGLGMGLALCRRIVERHGGRIWVESEPGEGSTFIFTLPLATWCQEELAEPSPAF